MELVFELISEEIPSMHQKQASRSLESCWRNEISKFWHNDDLNSMQVESYYSARRLTLIARNIPHPDNILQQTIKGPKITAPEAALAGFMKKYDICDISELQIKDDCYHHIMQKSSAEVIIQKALLLAVQSIKWPKIMRYGDESFSWIRPIKNILAILNEKILPISLGQVRANNQTFGHKFLSAGAISVTNADEYIDAMHRGGVMFNQDERLSMIKQDAETLAEKIDCQIIDDAALFEEISGLIEWPFALLCKIDEKFMTLPEEVIITTLRFHQKYIMLKTKEDKLAPYFIVIANVPGDREKIITGNERVLRARLDDAMFSMRQDSEKTLEERVLETKKLIFHRKIGTVYDKTMKMTQIAFTIAMLLQTSDEQRTNAERAAYLCKADLVSSVVGEFPELQGIIGYYHALENQESAEVAHAIRDHYKPEGPSDTVPTDIITVITALSDKIYNIVSLFNAGIKPTSSKDPYALRRAALGIIRIICANKLVLPLRSAKLNLSDEVLNFLAERLKHFDETGYDKSFAANSLHAT